MFVCWHGARSDSLRAPLFGLGEIVSCQCQPCPECVHVFKGMVISQLLRRPLGLSEDFKRILHLSAHPEYLRGKQVDGRHVDPLTGLLSQLYALPNGLLRHVELVPFAIEAAQDRKSTRLNSSHPSISYA